LTTESNTSRPNALKRGALSGMRKQLARFLRLAEHDAVLITRYGKPAGVLIGFKDAEDRFD
jgi:PHD/YefM family antitoxin component YafN of YafNO toxin-antitoxin module